MYICMTKTCLKKELITSTRINWEMGDWIWKFINILERKIVICPEAFTGVFL